MTADRALVLEGAENFRDLGGYPTITGRTTAWGKVFRAAALHELTDNDHAELTTRGIRRSFDLRGLRETTDAPDRLPSNVEYVHLPMTQAEAETDNMVRRISRGEYSEFTNTMMADGYLSMMTNYPEAIRTIAHAVTTGEPFVFHCAAGKDRTGVVAMVLLGLAGVDTHTIIDDYNLTETHRQVGTEKFRESMRKHGLDPDTFRTLGTAPREVMELTLAGIGERWGTIADYAETIGIDAVAQAVVRDRLTA